MWRVFFETAMALVDIVDDELQAEQGLSLRWYDVLVQLEEASDQNHSRGLPMNELAARILASKSGLTRVVDRMEQAELVRRERPPDDRRVVRVLITPKGIETLQAAREVHHLSIQRHFTEHLSDRELTGLANALEKVRRHVRPLRPQRIGAGTPAGPD
jgi:DNA-binding MarR family transcriptional regulator